MIPRPAEPGLIFRVCETSEEPEAFLERVRANAETTSQPINQHCAAACGQP